MMSNRLVSIVATLSLVGTLFVGGWVFTMAPQNSSENYTENPSKTKDAPPAKQESTSVAAARQQLPLAIQNELDHLREDIVSGQEERAELRQRLAEQERLLLALQDELGSAPGAAGVSDANLTGNGDALVARNGLGNEGDRVGSDQQREALAKSGVDSVAIDAIRQRQDEQTLARLELLDQAAREGWSNSERLRDELRNLNDTAVDIRDELTDAEYDRYLYNSGQPNRVVVQSIIGGSNADLAGILVGDVISRYADTSVFTMTDVRDATQAGTRGEPVLVQVRRDSQYQVLNVLRGPLGITMSAIREMP